MKTEKIIINPETCDYVDGEKYCRICTSPFYLQKLYKLFLKKGEYEYEELNSDDLMFHKLYNGFTDVKEINDKHRYVFYKSNKPIEILMITYVV